MSNWEKIGEERRKEVDRSNELGQKVARLIQTFLLGALTDWILGFDTDDAGEIEYTTRNAARVETVSSVFESKAKEAQKRILPWLANRVAEIVGVNQRYFKAVGAKDSELRGDPVALVLRQLGVRDGRIVRGSWLDELTSANTVKLEVMDRVNNAIRSGMTLKDFQKQFRKDFTDKDGLGLLSEHYGTHTRTLFASVDRATHLNYAKGLGLNHAVYAGTLKDNTRPFCKKRVNNVYTVEEIESWNGQDWAGKIDGANVLVVLGGFNCRHNLNWVTEQIAERIAKQRGGMNNYN